MWTLKPEPAPTTEHKLWANLWPPSGNQVDDAPFIPKGESSLNVGACRSQSSHPVTEDLKRATFLPVSDSFKSY